MTSLVTKVPAIWERYVAMPLRDVSGQTLAEYSVLITVVAGGLTLLAMPRLSRSACGHVHQRGGMSLDGSC